MNRVICSTGSLIGRPNGRDYRIFEQCIPRLECDAFEFMFYDTWYPEYKQVVDFLNGLGICIPDWHCEKRLAEKISLRENNDWNEAFEKFEINCEMARSVGSGRLVFHLWDGPVSDSRIANNYEALPRLIQISENYGLELSVENVICACSDPLTRWREIDRMYPEISFTLDTKMLHFHHMIDDIYDPSFLETWKKHIRHLHLNDRLGAPGDFSDLRSLHIGQGNIDFDAFFSYLPICGYQGDYTVESTALQKDGTIIFDDLKRTYRYIRKKIKENQNGQER